MNGAYRGWTEREGTALSGRFPRYSSSLREAARPSGWGDEAILFARSGCGRPAVFPLLFRCGSRFRPFGFSLGAGMIQPSSSSSFLLRPVIQRQTAAPAAMSPSTMNFPNFANHREKAGFGQHLTSYQPAYAPGGHFVHIRIEIRIAIALLKGGRGNDSRDMLPDSRRGRSWCRWHS